MTSREIKANSKEIKLLVKEAKEKIAEGQSIELEGRRDLAAVQNYCPHSQKESWENDDGCGSFVLVEKCLICGLQKDGGLK